MPGVNVSFSAPIEMLNDMDEQAQKHNMSRAEYIRHLIRQANDSPFDPPEFNLENNDEAQTGAA